MQSNKSNKRTKYNPPKRSIKKTYKKANKKSYQIKIDRPLKERKMFSNPYSETNITKVGGTSAEFIGCPVPGTAYYQRLGNSVIYKSIMFKCMITQPVDEEPNRVFRIVIVYDKQPVGGAAPQIQDILQDITPGGVIAFTGFSGNNVDNINRFAIIRDYIRSFKATDRLVNGIYYEVSGPSNQIYQGKKASEIYIEDYIKLPNLPQTFKQGASAGTIADIASGAFYIFCLGTSFNSAQKIGWSMRCRFTDN